MTDLPKSVSQKDSKTLNIVWKETGEKSYDVVALRRACGCAACVDEMTGAQILKDSDIPETVRPVSVKNLGRYALSLDWTDGHNSIFTWDRLVELAD